MSLNGLSIQQCICKHSPNLVSENLYWILQHTRGSTTEYNAIDYAQFKSVPKLMHVFNVCKIVTLN